MDTQHPWRTALVSFASVAVLGATAAALYLFCIWCRRWTGHLVPGVVSLAWVLMAADYVLAGRCAGKR